MGTSKYMKVRDLIGKRIGKRIEVFADIDGNEVKEILVTDVYTNSKGKCVIEDSEKNLYFEDSVNWYYEFVDGSIRRTIKEFK